MTKSLVVVPDLFFLSAPQEEITLIQKDLPMDLYQVGTSPESVLFGDKSLNIFVFSWVSFSFFFGLVIFFC